ncbi:MAG: phosphate ABC transporter ATP-binding protein [Acidimicrobiia bacterium]|nr:phosphate ABC transporter ATP-binding protein [Acidimicrobiia bacterium]
MTVSSPEPRAQGPKPSVLYEFDNVTVSRNGATILQDVTASVPEAGVTAIVGPSGSGKTTLLRLCNRLEVPASGSVLFRGTDIAAMDPLELRRRAGMVFQKPTLFPGTIRDNLLVAVPGAAEEKLRDALQRAELEPSFLDRTGDDLSGGEAQRACVARTLIADPEVMLFDEATSSLDAAPKARLEETARHIAQEGMAVLWVTHDLAQAQRLADHLLVVLAGRIEFSGQAAQLAGANGKVREFLDAG